MAFTFVLCLVIPVVAVNVQIGPAAKPGVCPLLGLSGLGGIAGVLDPLLCLSRVKCNSDFDCPGSEKCCESVSCGSVCRQVSGLGPQIPNIGPIGPQIPNSGLGPQIPNFGPIGPQIPNSGLGPQIPNIGPIGPQIPNSGLGPQIPNFGPLSPQIPNIGPIGPQIPNSGLGPQIPNIGPIGPQIPGISNTGMCSETYCPQGRTCVNTPAGPRCIFDIGNQRTCNSVMCPSGQTCQLKKPHNCFNPPCPSEPKCVTIDKQGTCPRQEYCPNSIFQPSACDTRQCFVDGDCPGRQKCCKQCHCNVCMHPPATCSTTTCPPGYRCEVKNFNCMNPPCYSRPHCVPIRNEKIQPGSCSVERCPRMGPFNRMCTSDHCQVDMDCPGHQKCCHVCGCRQCMGASWVGGVQSCNDMICGMGEVCQMQRTFCSFPPCPMHPVCQPSGMPMLGGFAASTAVHSGTGSDS